MNEEAILHIMDSHMSFPINKNEIVIRIRTSKFDSLKVSIIYGPKFTYHIDRYEDEMRLCYVDRLFNYFEIKLNVSDDRLAYIFKIEESGKTYYFSEDGISKDYDFDLGFYNYFQMPSINYADIMPCIPWMRSAVFYQIFIDRFNRGDYQKDDSYVNSKWGDIPRQGSFTGGDLKGIIDRLDYLKDLGINTLYLTPIFNSPSNHKYDIIDYYQIDSQFGDKSILKELVEKAHKNEIRIILDAVFNHISNENYMFKDVKDKGINSKYYDWFFIDGDYIEEDNVNYKTFSIVDYMPRLNTSNTEVQDYLIKVGKYWIEEFGIDGWRLDVSDEVSHNFWRRFRKEIKSIDKDAVLIGENWHDAASYLQGDQFDSIMNYSFTKTSLDYFCNKIDAENAAFKLNGILMRNKDQVNRMNLNLIDTHDTHRFYTEVDENKDKVLASIALMTMFLGAPCLYYGTEIFLEGGYDPDSRRNFDWDLVDKNTKQINTIKSIFGLKNLASVKYGDIKISSDKNYLIIRRSYENEDVSLYINLSQDISFDTNNSKILSSNKYNNEILEKDGYLIILNRSSHEK